MGRVPISPKSSFSPLIFLKLGISSKLRRNCWSISTKIMKLTSDSNCCLMKGFLQVAWLSWSYGLPITAQLCIIMVKPMDWSRCFQAVSGSKTSMSSTSGLLRGQKSPISQWNTHKVSILGYLSILSGFTDWWIYILRWLFVCRPITTMKIQLSISLLWKRTKRRGRLWMNTTLKMTGKTTYIWWTTLKCHKKIRILSKR